MHRNNSHKQENSFPNLILEVVLEIKDTSEIHSQRLIVKQIYLFFPFNFAALREWHIAQLFILE